MSEINSNSTWETKAAWKLRCLNTKFHANDVQLINKGYVVIISSEGLRFKFSREIMANLQAGLLEGVLRNATVQGCRLLVADGGRQPCLDLARDGKPGKNNDPVFLGVHRRCQVKSGGAAR